MHLGPIIASAADGLLRMPAALLGSRGLIRAIGELDLSSEPVVWARVVTHLLSNTEGTPWEARRPLQGVMEKRRGADPEIDLTEMIEQAMRLGAADAFDWIGAAG